MEENAKAIVVRKTAEGSFETAPIWQYDIGHVLVFEGFTLPDVFQAHFAHSPSGESIIQVGQNGQVALPDEYAQEAKPIYAWVYIAEDETGLTKYSINIPVMRRAKITDQQPTPVEQSAIDQAISALNAGVTRAETAAENAEQSADAASESAENAYRSSEAAAASAEGLAEAVAAAQNAAQTATGKASEAAQNATTAAQKAQEATSAATRASQSASAAETARTGAETAQSAAAGSATAAAGSASAAQTSAGNAASSATAAAGSAQAAAQTAAQFEQDITDLKSDIEAAPTEETGQEMLALEKTRTVLEETFLDELDRIFTNLPQDDIGQGIYSELVTECDWLDMLYHEMALRESA